MARSLSLVSLNRRRYKITLWLHPAEYWAIMHASASLGGGKLSFTKWFKKQAQIENAKADAEKHQHELAMLTKTWGKKRPTRVPALATVKRNSPRRLAAA